MHREPKMSHQILLVIAAIITIAILSAEIFRHGIPGEMSDGEAIGFMLIVIPLFFAIGLGNNLFPITFVASFTAVLSVVAHSYEHGPGAAACLGAAYVVLSAIVAASRFYLGRWIDSMPKLQRHGY